MKKNLVGAALTILLMFSSAAVVMRLGFLPVSADGSHSRPEARIMPAVLHASVARRAGNEKNPLVGNEENLKAGMLTYRTNSAICHSTAKAGPSDFGQAFYPPAPQL